MFCYIISFDRKGNSKMNHYDCPWAAVKEYVRLRFKGHKVYLRRL